MSADLVTVALACGISAIVSGTMAIFVHARAKAMVGREASYRLNADLRKAPFDHDHDKWCQPCNTCRAMFLVKDMQEISIVSAYRNGYGSCNRKTQRLHLCPNHSVHWDVAEQKEPGGEFLLRKRHAARDEEVGRVGDAGSLFGGSEGY